MTNLKELKRRALLGDRQAQKECAKKGVMLTCPLCKGKAEEGKQVDVDEYYWWPTICCGNCNLHIVGSELFGEVTEEMRLKWNTRPGPAGWPMPGLCALVQRALCISWSVRSRRNRCRVLLPEF